MSMDKPIKVRLAPIPDSEDGDMMLGPIRLCGEACEWLRKEFPEGGTFLDVWQKCPRGEWLGWVAYRAAERGGAKRQADRIWRVVGNGCGFYDPIPIEKTRNEIAYEDVERWLRKVMAGRPEVIG